MIGYFGPIKFVTNDKRILTFTDFKRDSSARWGDHAVIGRKPVSEFLGSELDTISFSVHLSASHGVNPRIEAEKWLRMNRNGEAHVLVLGKRGLGIDKWKIESVSQGYDVIFNKGEVYSCKVDISLSEYIEVF
ncbi:MAG: phage tail protein [Paenisporosarcina sp.]